MASNNLAKKTFVLIFLLAVLVAIFIWQGSDFSKDYLGWLRTGMAKLNPIDRMIGPELQLTQDSGLDLSNVNIEEIIAEHSEPIEEKVEEDIEESLPEEPEDLINEVVIGIGGPTEPIVVVSEKKITLEEIEQEINRIAEEVERIDNDVQALVALYE